MGESSSESEEERKERDKSQGGKKTPSKSTKPVTPPREDKVKLKKQGNSASPSKKDEKKLDKTEKADAKPKPKFHVNYEFFDPGNHWCRKCNVVSSNVYEVFQHLQKKQHISVSIFDFKLVIVFVNLMCIFSRIFKQCSSTRKIAFLFRKWITTIVHGCQNHLRIRNPSQGKASLLLFQSKVKF